MPVMQMPLRIETESCLNLCAFIYEWIYIYFICTCADWVHVKSSFEKSRDFQVLIVNTRTGKASFSCFLFSNQQILRLSHY